MSSREEKLYVKSPLFVPHPLCGVCAPMQARVFSISCVRKVHVWNVHVDVQVDVDADFDVEDYIHSHLKTLMRCMIARSLR